MYIPALLKYAEMVALFKKLGRLCKENYRPASILTALSKENLLPSINILFWPYIF